MRVFSVLVIVAMVISLVIYGNFDFGFIQNAFGGLLMTVAAVSIVAAFCANVISTLVIVICGVTGNWRKASQLSNSISWALNSFPLALLAGCIFTSIGASGVKYYAIPMISLMVVLLACVFIELRKILDDCAKQRRYVEYVNRLLDVKK